MKSRPQVSVIVPVYNTEKYLRPCIESIIRQSYKNLNVILINDGSTDGSESIMKDYGQLDSRITVKNQSNQGVSSARNYGISCAKGHFVVFVDADDAIHREFIANLVDTAISTNADIVTSPKRFSGLSMNEFMLQSYPNIKKLIYNRRSAIVALYNGNLEKNSNGVQLYRRKLLDDNKILFNTEMAIAEDFDFLARAILHAKIIVLDSRQMYYYRLNNESAVHAEFNISHYNAIENMQSAGRKYLGLTADLIMAMENNLLISSISYGAIMFKSRHAFEVEYSTILSTVYRLRFHVLSRRGISSNARIKVLIVSLLGTSCGFRIIRKLIKI